jgi:hypothetical protein
LVGEAGIEPATLSLEGGGLRYTMAYYCFP